MIYETEFLGTVSLEIEGRIPKITSQVMSDWHYECRDLTVADAISRLQEFFRQYEGKHLPKPHEFGKWVRAAIQKRVSAGSRWFDFLVAIPPYRTAIRVKHATRDGQVVYDGYAQRFRDCDIGHIDYHLPNGRMEQCGIRPELMCNYDVKVELAPDIDPFSFEGPAGPDENEPFTPQVKRRSVVGGTETPF